MLHNIFYTALRGSVIYQLLKYIYSFCCFTCFYGNILIFICLKHILNLQKLLFTGVMT